MKFKIGPFRWSSRAEHKRMAALVAVALVALVAGVALIVRIVRMPAPRAHQARVDAAASLNLARLNEGQHDQVLNEEAQLFDPAPLFLPTIYNSSQTDDTLVGRHEPGESLPREEPRFVYSDTAFDIPFPDPAQIPARPVDVLDYGRTQTPYVQFGRADQPEKPLAARMAQVEIVQMKTGRTVLALSLPPASPASAMPDALAAVDWQPLEFVMALDVTGLVGAPTLVQGSGSPAVDDFFANYLARNLHLGQRRELTAGFYILRIGP